MTKVQILIAMIAYMCIVIGIGFYFMKRAQKNPENYFLGGRSLGPWVAAMSAEASDMSGWLLMGLPGVAYWCGLADAAWTALGLAIGTYVNWLIVSKRLRNYSYVAGNAITLQDFFSNRFKENKKVILGISSVFILVFFTVYASSCFVTCGKLFSGLFDVDYHAMLIVGALFVLVYTIIGGFLAESVSDFMQSIVMLVALIGVVVFGVKHAGGISAVIDNAKNIDGYLSLTKLANPVNSDGASIATLSAATDNVVQGVKDGVPMFGEARSYGVLKIFSMLAWGLGYFGMPQVLLRFMAIRKCSELKRSRRIATVWVLISLSTAVFIGFVGRSVLPVSEALNTASKAENVFAELGSLLFHPVIAGVVMAGILAATISSSDSYLLIAGSAVSQGLYKGIFKKDASDKQVMWLSRIVILLIALLGIVIAWDDESVIFDIVSFAWAGFGATFGPLMLFSLFWKRTTRAGAVAGMLSGGITVFFWKLVLNPNGGVFEIYELLPAFIVSSVFIVVVSLVSPKPSKEIEEEFERAKVLVEE